MVNAIAAGEQAIALISAFDQSCAHADAGGAGDDVGGQAMLDIVDEMALAIYHSDTEQEMNRYRDELFATVVSLAGMVRGSLDHVDADVNLAHMMQNSAQEAHRRMMAR